MFGVGAKKVAKRILDLKFVEMAEADVLPQGSGYTPTPAHLPNDQPVLRVTERLCSRLPEKEPSDGEVLIISYAIILWPA